MANFVFRVFLWLFLLAVGGAGGFAAARLLRTDDNATVITVYEDWRLVCPPAGEQPCHADQDVIDGRTGAVLARLAIAGSSGARMITITLPHNLLIPPGIALKVGNAPAQAFPYDLCDRVGCIVPIHVEAKGEAKLRNAERGSIAVVNADNKPATILFSLRGLGMALDALDRASSARSSWWQKILS
jgi:invasion protein IalB